MSWRVVARRDALDPYRSGALWMYLALFALTFGGAGYVTAQSQASLGTALTAVAAVLVPLAVLVIGYPTLAKRRENGALRVLLALPHSRRDVVLGTAVGRVAISTGAISVGFLAGVVGAVANGAVPRLDHLLFAWALTALLGAAMAAVGVAISASVRTETRAAASAFGAFLLLVALWGQLPGLARYVANGFSPPPPPPPDWVDVFAQLSPVTAFRTATDVLLRGASSVGVHETWWFAVLVVLAWVAVPLALATWRFDGSDL